MAVASRTMGGQRTEAEVRARGDDGRDQVPAAQDDAVWASAALTGADTGRGAEGVAEAADSLQDGPVRIIAVARSRRHRGGDELADLEARRAVAIALEAAQRMLGATGRDLDAAASALPRGVMNRWRAGAVGESTPGPGEGTSLVVALAGRAGVRVVRFGLGAAAVVAADGTSFLPYVPPILPPSPTEAGPDEDGWDDEGQKWPEPLIGLDHPDASRTYDTLRVSGQHRPTLVVLSGSPEDGVAESARSAWVSALADLDSRLAAEADASTADTHGAIASTHAEDHDLPTPDHDLPVADQPPPAWIAAGLPVSASGSALAWLPGPRAAVAPAAVADVRPARTPRPPRAPASPRPARAPGRPGQGRLLVLALSALLVLGLAARAWALLAPRAETPSPRDGQVLPTASPLQSPTSTPTPSVPSPSATPSSTAATPIPSATPTPSTRATPTRTPTRAVTRAPSTTASTSAAPTPTATPTTESPTPSATATPSSSAPTPTPTDPTPTPGPGR